MVIQGLIVAALAAAAWAAGPLDKEDGYRGIWYYNQPSKDEFVYKYSGGFATYPQQQSPIAIYSKAADKTFFCYGGTVRGKRELLYMVSYYDHKTGMVPRPRVLMNKQTEDAHDNPVMSIDDSGHIWIFGNSHGTGRASLIFRSAKPYSIDEFTKVWEGNFSYGHPRWLSGMGFFFLQTKYEDRGRSLYWTNSDDGMNWTSSQLLARADLGHYQITAAHGRRVCSVFNYHPAPVGLNERANVYYVETDDRGNTWKTADGKRIATPIKDAASPALVYDSRSEGKLVYLKTVDFDAAGHPVILYLTSKGYESGPKNGRREWWTARWDGKRWDIRPFTVSDHNYDFGTLSVESDGEWRVIAPTEPGPQPWCTGGDMVLWSSRDHGKSWKRLKQLTRATERNHTYARKPVGARPDFYSIWADGDAKKPSESYLYFSNRDGDVWRLPPAMSAEFMRPERVR